MMVVVMTVPVRESGAGEYHQQQCGGENLFHRGHPTMGLFSG
jgi:hypothetical protein